MVVTFTRESARGAAWVLLLALASCEGEDMRQPIDGGYGLDLGANDAAMEKILANDPCWRRERGAWHYSLGHCREMSDPEEMTGVWITGFEMSSFFRGSTAVPSITDWKRPITMLEIDAERVSRMVDHEFDGPESHAVVLTIVGRRTKYPIDRDCFGGRHYAIVADRVERTQYLGRLADELIDVPLASELPPYVPFKRSGEGGIIGQMEEEALARCNGSAEPAASTNPSRSGESPVSSADSS